MAAQPLEIVARVVEVLVGLRIEYHLGGSFAGAVHGEPRQTNDADLVVALEVQHVPAFVAALEGEFYLDEGMARSAVLRRASFNLVHLATGFKVDLFVRGDRPFDHSEFFRHQPEDLHGEPPRRLYVKSAEDLLLRKLEWYELGGRVSDKQWRDIISIVRSQGARLDRAYLERWAPELGVKGLLAAALEDGPGGGSG